MIRTQKSAVTAISYGLIAALVIVVSLGALTAAGVDIENVFSISGNAMSSVMVPNANLTAEQQSEIANSAAEIAAGTASAACLQYMNNNTSTVASNNATCLGPGYGIAPPVLPVELEFNGAAEVEPNGLIYAAAFVGSFSTASASAGSNAIILYRDGQELSGNNYGSSRASQCQSGSYGGYSSSVGNPSIINGNEIVCSGIYAAPGELFNKGKSPSNNAPFGYGTSW